MATPSDQSQDWVWFSNSRKKMQWDLTASDYDSFTFLFCVYLQWCLFAAVFIYSGVYLQRCLFTAAFTAKCYGIPV